MEKLGSRSININMEQNSNHSVKKQSIKQWSEEKQLQQRLLVVKTDRHLKISYDNN